MQTVQWLEGSWRLAGRIARLSLVLLVLQVAFTAWSFQRARASVDALGLAVAARFMAVAEAYGEAPPTVVTLNGALFGLRSGYAPHSPSEVLDVFAERCRQHDGGLAAGLGELAGRDDWWGATLAHRAAAGAVIRTEVDQQGMVACLDMGDSTLEMEDWVARFEGFAQDGDVSLIGGLRMLSARRSDRGGSFFVGIWSQGPLPLLRMFPAEGDAPGADHPSLPRPPWARRLISAWPRAEGGQRAPEGLQVFHVPGVAVSEVWSEYRSTLQKRGWTVREGAGVEAPDAVLVEHGRASASLRFEASDSGTQVSIAVH